MISNSLKSLKCRDSVISDYYECEIVACVEQAGREGPMKQSFLGIKCLCYGQRCTSAALTVHPS